VVSKLDFLERMRAARAELNEAISGLSEAHMSQDIVAGEAWAVRDILAHIAAWQIETLRSIERTERGQDTGPLINESESEWDARRVAERRQLPLVDVMQEFHQAHDELLAALDRSPSDTVPLGPAGWDETAQLWWLTDHDREHLDVINAYRQRLSQAEGQ
jgi:hypothetical protein